MSHAAAATSSTPPGRAALWIGRILSVGVASMLIMSAAMKLSGGAELVAGLGHLGVPIDLVGKLAAAELTCVLLYLLPHTAVLGAVLLTGYLGGATFAHLRVGDSFIFPALLGVVVWAGLFLREPRLRRLLPLRSV